MRQTKIKRTKRLYSGKSKIKTILKSMGATLIIAVLIFIGWNMAPPIIDFIKGEHTGDSSTPETSENVQSSGPESEISGESSAETPVSSEPAVINNDIKAISLGNEMYDINAVNNFAENAKNKGYNAVVITLKNEAGFVTYNSNLPQVSEWGTKSDGAVDAKAIAEALKAHSLIPIAKIHAFKDDKAAYWERDNTFLYGGSVSWLDAAGGKKWLNPYKQNAKNYIIDIALEIADFGYEQIIIDSVQFPDVSISNANAGNTGGVSKAQALSSFVNEMNNKLTEKNVKGIFSFRYAGIVDQCVNQYETSPMKWAASYFAPIIDINKLPDRNIPFAGVIAEDNSYSITKAIISKAVEDAASTGAQLIPVVPDNGNKEDVLKALDELGIKLYIIE